MKKINLFLASSNELKADREAFEIQIYRKTKSWFDKGVFLHLNIWEDQSAKMSPTRSQDEYNKVIQSETDVFILLAHTKVGMFTAEEFEQAFGKFQVAQKPFIFIYFKNVPDDHDNKSLKDFKQKIWDLEHFAGRYSDFNDLWNQFNKELDRLEADDFMKNDFEKQTSGKRIIQQGDKSVYIEKGDGINFTIN